MWVQITKLLEVGLAEAHNAELVDVTIIAELFQYFWLHRLIWHKWAEFHFWIQIEEQLIVAKNCVSRHDHRGELVLVRAFDFESRMVETERTLHREEHLRHLVVRPHETDSCLVRLLVAARIESYCHLVNESAITRIEEVSKVLTELLKDQFD